MATRTGGRPAPRRSETDETPVVVGIDPGLQVCGWGVVSGDGRPHYVACGIIKTTARQSLAERLRLLHESIEEVILHYQPTEVAIEDPFIGKLAPASALAIGQARAVAVLAAAEAGLPVSFYAPATVKLAVTGYGRGDKAQVQAMVRLQLELSSDPHPSDAADALAVALCHISQRRLRALRLARDRL